MTTVNSSHGLNMSGEVSSSNTSPVWVVCFALSTLMTLANIWIAFAFVLYARSSSILSKACNTDMDGGLIFKAALASVILPIFKYATTLAIMIIGLDAENHTPCLIIIYISNLCLVAPILSIYLFLWLRQRAFYSHPSLGSIFSAAIARLSKLSLALIIPPILTSLIVDMAINRYNSGHNGCVFATNQSENNYRFFIYGAILTLGQGTLIGLFVYPLYLHSKARVEMFSERSDTIRSEHGEDRSCVERAANATELQIIAGSSNTRHENVKCTVNESASIALAPSNEGITTAHYSKERPKKRRKVSKVYKLIKRTLMLACVSMLSDILGMGVSGLMATKDRPYYIVCILLDVDIAVNTVSIVGSFRNWTEILFGRVVKYFKR